MKFHSVVTTLAMAASICVPTTVFAAPAASVHSPVHAFFGKVHMVTVNLRNDTSANITVKAGDKELTLLPGKPQSVKLAAGDKIVATAQCAGHSEGEVLSTVDPMMDQGTLGLK
jgi:Na+-transporting NADH:ubiquinone oxidoreductase subunit NqrF